MLTNSLILWNVSLTIKRKIDYKLGAEKEKTMSILNKCREGSWWFDSETDKRWTFHGGRSSFITMADMTKEAKIKLAELKALYGEPPDDLSYGCMKD